MAGLITHMVIAREIIGRLPKGTISDPGIFYLGNLAPDSIHARDGYIRAYKKHTHMRDDIPDIDFNAEENRQLFHRRVADFILENRNRPLPELDLYRGYVVHILADELFMLTIRNEFCDTMEQLGIAQDNPLFFKYIVDDMNRNDYLLIDQYEGSKEIQVNLETVRIYPVAGYLSEQEIRISRDWLLRQHFYQENGLLNPRYISKKRMWDYIQLAADQIVWRLSGEGDFPKML